MSKGTRATEHLKRAGVAFSLHSYAYDPDARHIGLHAADALGETAEKVLKTLMVAVDGKPVCAIVPSDQTVAMKKLAAAVGGKSARMLDAPAAERVTGYKVGGISPFGQAKAVPMTIDQAALAHPLVYVNGGQRGLQLRLSPIDAQELLGAVAATLCG
jgi:Cys-tRNA(Pro)/Cys-tRNA(Cys) deacylase